MIIIGSEAVYEMRHYKPKMSEEYSDTHIPLDEQGISKYIVAKYAQSCDKMLTLSFLLSVR